MRKYDYILFDLDGTLIESALSVRVSLEYAMKTLELPCPDLSDYSKYVGPPLEDTFRGMCAVPEELIPMGMQLYRDYYNEVGIRSNQVYSGMTDVLDKLRKSGCKLAICTSKNEAVARFAADTVGLTQCFDAICGSTFDGSRRAKADIIPYALRTLGCVDQRQAVMIGDTHFDAKGAAVCSVDFIGVTYGYGDQESMKACGAVGFADSPAALLTLLDH